jgi:hypothetical protein
VTAQTEFWDLRGALLRQAHPTYPFAMSRHFELIDGLKIVSALQAAALTY